MRRYRVGLVGQPYSISGSIPSGPCSSNDRNCSSVRIGVPICSALASLDAPGEAPATRAEVFPETEEADRPPLAVAVVQFG